ncbi:hypothetical protein JCM8208_003253 [Rhodotorula glutinis]
MLVAADPHKLKPWLVRALEPISDAEPVVLADYVLALLKRDVRDLDELRQFCIHQLDDFLEHHSAPFVDSLLSVLQQSGRASPGPVVRGPTSTAPATSLKRARSPQPATSSAKLSRTQDGDGGHGARGYAALPPLAVPAGPSTRVPPGRASESLGNREPCRDYHFRGFCARGNACPYQHDALPPTFPSPFPSTIPPPFALATAARPFSPGPRDGAFSFRVSQDGPSRGATSSSYTRAAGPSARQVAPAARPARGASRVISVDNIPPTSLTDAAVRHFFQPFGAILHLGVDVDGRSATIMFSAPHEADRALASPQAVFGNRFVRVYRAVDPGVVPSASVPNDGREQDVAGARLVTARPALEDRSTAGSAPAPVQASMTRARQLEHNAEQQRVLLSEVQAAGGERKRDIMVALRALATEADELRSRARADVGEPARGDARARLLELQREAASLGIDTTGSSSGRPGPLRRSATSRPRPPPRVDPQQFRLDNRSRNLRIGPLEQDGKLGALRAHLELFGEVVALDYDPEAKTGTVEFAVRKSAEQALAAGRLPQEFAEAKLSWAPSYTNLEPRAASAGPPGVVDGINAVEPQERSRSSGAPADSAQGRESMQMDVKGEDEERSWNR